MEKMDIHAFPTERKITNLLMNTTIQHNNGSLATQYTNVKIIVNCVKVLLKILGLLSDVDLKTVQTVTFRLDTIVNEGIGFPAAIGQNSQFASKSSPRLDWPEKVLSKGVSKCWVADLTEKIDDPRFKFPTILKEIHFEGPITQINFNSILLPLTGLQHLTLHFSTLAYPGLILTDRFLSECILQSFSLTSTACEQAMQTDPNERDLRRDAISGNMSRFTDNCLTLCKNLKSSRLVTFLLSMPFDISVETELVINIMECVSRHGQTLRNVQIYVECIYKGGSRNLSNPEMESGDEEILPPKEHKIDWSNFKATNLRRFSFANCDHTKNIFEPELTKLIRCQKNLSELYFLNRGQKSDNSFVLKDMSPKNLSTLKKILIHMNAVTNHVHGQDNPLDLVIFQECSKLSHFVLRGEPTILTENKPIVKNVRMLPKSISLLSIRDILVRTSDTVDIFGLGRLKRIRLINIGCTEEFGVPLQTFFSVMGEKKLEEYEFTNSINLETLNWRLNVMQMCMLQKLQTLNKLHSILDSDGMSKDYFIKDRDMFDYSNDPENLRANDICNIVFK